MPFALTIFLTVLAAALILNVLACLVVLSRAPSPRERLLGVILGGTTVAATLAALSVLLDVPALRDAALVVVALASLVALARVGAEEDHA